MQTTTKTILATVAAAAVTTALGAPPATAKRAQPNAARCVSALVAGDEPVAVIPLPNGGRIWIFDRDGDKRADGIVVDSDGDGKPDAAASDCDRDGKFDTYWSDRNRNGEVDPDEVTRKKTKTQRLRVGSDRCHVQLQLKRRGVRPLKVVLRCARPSQAPPSTIATVEPALPATATAPGGAPATPPPPPPNGEVIILELVADVDGDSEREQIAMDRVLAPSQSTGATQDADDDIDIVRIGGAGGANVAGTASVDNDAKDDEIVVEDPTVSPNNSYGIDLDGDGDHDIIVIGTKGGAKVVRYANVDNDPNDVEIVVEDPTVSPNNSYGIDLDGDGDHDVIVIGTKS